MPRNFVMVTGLCRTMPAEYLGQWNGRPLRIRLDTGATLRLMGDGQSADKAEILANKTDLIARVAQRLIDMRIEKPTHEGAEIIISALDVEEPCSSRTGVAYAA
jgi:hypothetical protein